MKTMHFYDDRGVHWSVDVPDDAQPFGIGAVCPSCNPDSTMTADGRRFARVVEAIDFNARVFQCAPRSAGHVPAADLRKHPFPPVTLEIDDRVAERLAPLATVTSYRPGIAEVAEYPMQRQEIP